MRWFRTIGLVETLTARTTCETSTCVESEALSLPRSPRAADLVRMRPAKAAQS